MNVLSFLHQLNMLSMTVFLCKAAYKECALQTWFYLDDRLLTDGTFFPKFLDCIMPHDLFYSYVFQKLYEGVQGNYQEMQAPVPSLLNDSQIFSFPFLADV